MGVLFACMSRRAGRGHSVLWNWSHRQSAALRVLGSKPRSSGRATQALNHSAISPVHSFLYFCIFFSSSSPQCVYIHIESSVGSLSSGLPGCIWPSAFTLFPQLAAINCYPLLSLLAFQGSHFICMGGAYI